MHCGPEKHVKEMARIIKYLCENDDLKLTFDVVPDDDGLDEYLKDADELVMSPLANVSNRT